jgi:hypothetical protein
MSQWEDRGPLSFIRNFSKKETKIDQSPSQVNFASYRVKDIILDDTFQDLGNNEPPHGFAFFGEWNGIGTIIIEPINDNTSGINTDPTTYAYPLFPNIKHYPLKGEIVWTIQLTDIGLYSDNNIDVSQVSHYYLPPINIWNSQIHNAVPSQPEVGPPSPTINDYQDIENGSSGGVRRITDNTTDIDLGKTFNESNVTDIHPLLPYEGDIIYEGRFGNSIRFGSTVKKAKYNNNWSSNGIDGDPITIIRNGQSSTQKGVTNTSEAWIPCLENINDDQSSFYLTSTQQVPLILTSNGKGSYKATSATEDIKETPQSPNQFSGNQILLNSGRLVFNAKNDHIILNADKSVHLSSNGSINIDTNITSVFSNEIRLTSSKVFLGNGSKFQPAVLGDDLKQTLSIILNTLERLGKALIVAGNAGGSIPSLNQEGPKVASMATQLKSTLNDLLSKTTKIS